jgi:hypothetical protein
MREMEGRPPPRRRTKTLAGYREALSHYLVSHGGFDETVADLKRQFRFIGDSGAYHFLHTIDQPVPPYDEWFGASPRPQRRRRPARQARRRGATGGAGRG